MTFFSALLLAFIILKLTGLIDWPWLWVLAPLWIPLTLAMLCIFAYRILLLFETPQQRAARQLEETAKALRKARK